MTGFTVQLFFASGRWLMHLNQLERASNTGSGILRTVHPEYHSRGAICHNSTRIPKAIKE